MIISIKSIVKNDHPPGQRDKDSPSEMEDIQPSKPVSVVDDVDDTDPLLQQVKCRTSLT